MLPDGTRKRPSLRELAERHQLNPTTVAVRASKEKWVEEQERFATKVQAASQVALIKTLASQASDFDNRSLEMAKAMLGLIALRLNELTRPAPDGTRKSASASELLKLTMAGRNAQAMGKVALGDWAGETPVPGAGLMVTIRREGPVPQFGDDGRE